MSLRSGNNKKQKQCHQNKEAFKINFDQQALDMHKKVQLTQMCEKCIEQIKWKMQYNKYKLMNQPSKCYFCLEKVVVRSYMQICNHCSSLKNQCAKCLISLNPQNEENDSENNVSKCKNTKEDKKNMENYIKSLRERSRRTILRKLEQKKIVWKEKNFVNVEDGEEVKNLCFKKNEFDDDDDFSDQDSESQDSKSQKSQDNQIKKKANSDDEFITDEEDQ